MISRGRRERVTAGRLGRRASPMDNPRSGTESGEVPEIDSGAEIPILDGASSQPMQLPADLGFFDENDQV